MKELITPISVPQENLEKKAKYDGFIDGNPLPIWSLGDGIVQSVAMAVKERFPGRTGKWGITP